MNLDLVNDLFNNLKENKFVQNFMNEISDYLESNLKNNIDCKKEELPIIEKILTERNVTTGNENAIRFKENDTIIKYAEKTGNDETMYFVKDSKNTYWLNNKRHYNNDVYTVLKVKNSNYVIDNLATKELQEEIANMADEILDKQDVNLSEYRKEGHLYMVKEELNNKRFLWDLTDASKTEFEEVNIPKDLLNKATEGTVLKYTNGRYEYYSDDGFERAEKIHSSSKNMLTKSIKKSNM